MNSEYILKIDFKKCSEYPERIFKSMADLIQVFRNVDQILAQSICADIHPVLLLQEIETGSIKTKLASVLRAIDDSAIKGLKWKEIVGTFLVKGKYLLIEYLEDKETIDSINQIEEIQTKLIELAQETNILHIPSYSPVTPWNLLNAIQHICDSIRPLLSEDQAIFISNSKSLLIAPKFNISQESIETLLTDQSLIREQEMVLKVKKPDFLGQSMWEDRKSVG